MTFPKSTRILIVEDNLTMRIVLKQTLERIGFTALREAADGLEALQLLETGTPADLIITDHYMPRMSGLELLTMLQANPKFSKTPVVLMTVDTERKMILRALELGAANYLIKPVSVHSLDEKLAATWKRLHPEK